MYLLLVSIVGAGALLLLAGQWVPRPDVETAQQAQAQLQQYQAFLYASRAFFSQAPAPAVTTAYGWNAVKASAAPSMINVGMPPHWKAVRRPDGYWVACTELSETTLAKLPTLFPPPSRPAASGSVALLPLTIPSGSISTVVGTGGGSQPGTPSYVVLGQQGGEAASSANLCSAT